jgi:hypothetical protein
MRMLTLAILISAAFTTLKAQGTICDGQLDSAAVRKIALRKNAYWTEDWLFSAPSLKFDSLACTWTVSSGKRGHTEKGDCKYTNGCTTWTRVVLTIDARTKRVIDKTVTIHLDPNYE